MRWFKRSASKNPAGPTGSPPAPKPSPVEGERERRQAEGERAKKAAARDRAEQEAAEARRVEARTRRSTEEIARACRAQGFWWPGEAMPESRLSPRTSWRSELIERIFGRWR